MSETLVRLEPAQDMISARLRKAGVYKTQSELIRAGINELAVKHKVFKNFKELEDELVEKKLKQEREEMKKKGIKYLSEKEALAKYR